jgi:hypothetical protein
MMRIRLYGSGSPHRSEVTGLEQLPQLIHMIVVAVEAGLVGDRAQQCAVRFGRRSLQQLEDQLFRHHALARSPAARSKPGELRGPWSDISLVRAWDPATAGNTPA